MPRLNLARGYSCDPLNRLTRGAGDGGAVGRMTFGYDVADVDQRKGLKIHLSGCDGGVFGNLQIGLPGEKALPIAGTGKCRKNLTSC